MDRTWPVWIIVGYLVGSIPFALLIGKAHGVDIRKVGSGNVGATNVSRAVGRGWGLLCFLLDALKGLAPVLAAGLAMRWIGDAELRTVEAFAWLGVAAAAVCGHIFPVWLRFRGGKGAATGIGSVLGFWPMMTLPAVTALTIWILFVVFLRYVSLATVAAACALTASIAVVAFTGSRPAATMPFLIVAGSLSALIIVRHRTNIARILGGTEPRIGRLLSRRGEDDADR